MYVELDWDRRPASECLQGVSKTTLGQDRRMHAARDLADVVKDFDHAFADPGQLHLKIYEVGRRHRRRDLDLERERDESLLGSVM